MKQDVDDMYPTSLGHTIKVSIMFFVQQVYTAEFLQQPLCLCIDLTMCIKTSFWWTTFLLPSLLIVDSLVAIYVVLEVLIEFICVNRIIYFTVFGGIKDTRSFVIGSQLNVCYARKTDYHQELLLQLSSIQGFFLENCNTYIQFGYSHRLNVFLWYES